MLATALALQTHSHSEFFPPRAPLSSLPLEIDGWTGTDSTLDQQTLDILGPGDFLQRDYENASRRSPARTMDRSLHCLLSFAKDRRYHPFAEPLPARRGMGSDFARDGAD